MLIALFLTLESKVFLAFRQSRRGFFSGAKAEKYQNLWADLDSFAMPKSKEMVSSDGSSSEEEVPKKGKKEKEQKKSKRQRSDSSEDEPKKKAPSSSKKSAPKADADEPSWSLGNMREVKVREFRGKVLIDIREFYLDKETGDTKPGRKGISLTAGQFQKLVDCLPEVQEAVKAK